MNRNEQHSPARLAVVGAGLVGQRHAEIVAQQAVLAAIADPAPAGRQIAENLGVPVYPDIAALLTGEELDGVIVATPNQRHEEDGLACIEAGLPVLIEKPIASDLAAAQRLVTAAKTKDLPLLVGHHRRYNPLIVAAREAIVAGRLGDLVAANAMCWLYKPDPYFDVEWRREPGAGPVFINLIHDVDLMMHLCGDVRAVQAVESNAVRGNNVEDTAAVLLHFENGVLGTITVSDTVVAPWSWELTAAENPAYSATGSFAYTIGGTRGSLSIPDLGLWKNEGTPGWHEPMTRQTLGADAADPLIAQVCHFAEVSLGQATPKVTGLDGLKALSVITAIKQAAASGTIVEICL